MKRKKVLKIIKIKNRCYFQTERGQNLSYFPLFIIIYRFVSFSDLLCFYYIVFWRLLVNEMRTKLPQRVILFSALLRHCDINFILRPKGISLLIVVEGCICVTFVIFLFCHIFFNGDFAQWFLLKKFCAEFFFEIFLMMFILCNLL